MKSNSSLKLYFGLLCCLALLGIFTKQWMGEGDVPNFDELHQIEGKIETVWASGKYGNTIRIKLENDPRYFVYGSISGEAGLVKRLTLVGSTAKLDFSPLNTHSPIFDDNTYHTIYQLTIDEKLVRAYSQIARKYRENASDSGRFAIILSILAFSIFRSIVKETRTRGRIPS